MEQIDRAMTQRAKDQMDRWREESLKATVWEKKYLENILYLGMPESEFVNFFTKTSKWTDSERPYITKQIGNRYILSGLTSSHDYRVTFENGKLIKFETFVLDKIPPLTAHYSDATHFLKGYKGGSGLYSGMPESELNKFEILSHSGNIYIVIGNDQRRYKVTFKNGYLVGMKSLSR
jgi:hypothetical protein